MSLRKEIMAMSKVVRPKLLKLAEQHKLMHMCFDEFVSQVYPGASESQIKEMRTCFMAGAAEFYTCWMYGVSITQDDEPTNEDMKFVEGLTEEIDNYHRNILAQHSMDKSGKKPN